MYWKSVEPRVNYVLDKQNYVLVTACDGLSFSSANFSSDSCRQFMSMNVWLISQNNVNGQLSSIIEMMKCHL